MKIGITLRVVLVTLFAIVVGVLIPGVIANRDRVMFRDQFDDKLRTHPDKDSSAWLKQVSAVEDYRKTLEARKLTLERDLKYPDAGAAKPILEEHAALNIELKQLPDVVVPFYGSLLMPLWFWTFLTVGCLLFVCPPGRRPWKRIIRDPENNDDDDPVRMKHVLGLAAAIFLFYEWPTPWRYRYGPRDSLNPPHPLYYNAHLASVPSYCYELLLDGIYCLMLATLLLRWIAFSRRVMKRWEHLRNYDPHHRYMGELLNPDLSRTITSLFEEWLVVSVLFASSYMFDTVYYWHQVHSQSSSLYVVQAVLEHTVWGISWLIISAPLLMVLRLRSRVHGYALRQLWESAAGPTAEMLTLIESSQPLSDWILVLAKAGAVGAFAASLFHAVSG